MMLELSTVMSVSTTHIQQSTAEWLDEQADKGPPSLIVYNKKEYGFFVLVPTDEQIGALPFEATHRYDLMGLLWIARHHKARWLELDRDVAPDKLLPQWDW